MTIGADNNAAAFTDRQWPKRRLFGLGLIACLIAPASQTSRSTTTTLGDRLSLQSDGEVLTLIPGAPVDRELSTAMTHRYRLGVRAGDYVRLTVDQHGANVGVRLVTPGGATLVDVGYRQDEPKVVSAVLESSGSYGLEIRSLETTRITGRYMAQVQQQRTARDGDAHRVLADRMFNEGETLRSDSRPGTTTASTVRYRRALALWRVARDREGQAKSGRRLGEALHFMGKSTAALAQLLDSLAVSRVAADAEAESAALAAAARVCLDLGRMGDATKFSQLAVDLSRKTRDRRGEAAALNVLGDVNMFSGRSRASLGHYREALAISERLLDRRGQAQALLNLGYTYGDLAQVPDAQQSYEGALILWRALGDARGQALTLTGLGQLGAVAGDNQQALGRYRDAKALFELSGDRVGLASTLNGLGMVHFRLGEANTSIAYLRRAVDLFKAVRLPNGEAGNLLDLGRCLTVLGRHREALRHYLAALSIARSIADGRLEARALGQIGRSFAALAQLDRARRYYRRASQLARAVDDPLCEFDALGGLAELLHRQGRNAEALSYLDDAFRLAVRSKHRFAEYQARYDLARIQRALDRLEPALANVRAALDLVEVLRSEVVSLDLRASYLASIRAARELEIDIVMSLHERMPDGKYNELAFEASERARARSFLDGLAQVRAGITEGVAPELLEHERSLRRALNAKAQQLANVQGNGGKAAAEAAALLREIEAITASHREAEARIRAESPRYAALTQPKPLTLKEIQTLVVDEQSVLLQYFIGKDRSYVWAVMPDRIHGFTLPAREEIERRVRSYRAGLTAPAGAPLKAGGLSVDHLEDARALSRMLLGPVAAYLTRPRVLIVSDGILHLLPFSALPDPRTIAADTQLADPLALAHELVHLPSASTLALLRRNWKQDNRWPKTARVFADPIFEADDPRIQVRKPANGVRPGVAIRAQPPDSLTRALRDVGGFGDGIPRLLETRREARAIAALAPAIDTALDFDANRAGALSATLAQYRVIHFATHGIVDNDHPELSGIILSLFNDKGEPQDGFLRLHDIYNLKLPVDLVVLSACSTATGKEVVGEGLIGLVRGFMYAGSRRVLASLWKVDDEATGELMTRFYRGVFEKGLTPPAALQAAQIELLTTRRWQHPFYWAGFVLQGEWK
jgi:CHAT domain-containing protein/tetratricopeptide (TPR) repeat protein